MTRSKELDDESRENLAIVVEAKGSAADAIQYGLALAAEEIRFERASDEALAALDATCGPEPSAADVEWAERVLG